jgi:hypothetical protein
MAGDPAQTTASQNGARRENATVRARRFGIAVLFSAILLIPRLRRLRKRPRAWMLVRILAGFAGAALAWRFARDGGGAVSLILGLALAAGAILTRARPERKSVDDVARELEALVVLNGGAFSAADARIPQVSIFVHPERLMVLTPAFECLADIPLTAMRGVCTIPAGTNGHRSAEAWELRIDWESSGPQAARFVYHGVFAEHLARIAGQTITSVWKKSLPIVRT